MKKALFILLLIPVVVKSQNIPPKGAKVLVRSNDNGGRVHAKNEFDYYNYWRLVNEYDKPDSFYTAYVKIDHKGLAVSCHIYFLDIIGDTMLKTSGTTIYAADQYNPKRSAIIQNIKDRIKPMMKK